MTRRLSLAGRCRRTWLLFFAGAVVAAAQPAAPAPTEAAPASPPASATATDLGQVVIVANRDVPESLELAAYYAKRRGLPADNIIALALGKEETIDRATFTRTLWAPLQETLLARRLLEGVVSSEGLDALGRPRVAITGHHLRYLVLIYGVPLRVNEDATIAQDDNARLPKGMPGANHASVDSELATLALGNTPLRGLLGNPLFSRARPGYFETQRVVRTARLDGPKPEDVRRLIDHALQAEHDGVWGRAYIDVGGPHPPGNEWIEKAGQQLLAAGFDVTFDREKSLFPREARFDAPLFYFGWYFANLNGSFLQSELQIPPGAIALHIHSFSATSLRKGGWVAPLIARGYTAAFGNVFEPLLGFTHRPDLLVQRLLEGAELGDAAFFCLPVLSWQTVFVGDPLYRPLARSQEEMWTERAKLSPQARRYVVLQRVAQRVRASDNVGALALVRELAADDRAPAVLLTYAQRLEAVGDKLAAGDELARVRVKLIDDGADRAIYGVIARQLEAWGRPADALDLWIDMAGDKRAGNGLRLVSLRAALPLAQKLNDSRKVRLIEARIAELEPKPKPGKAPVKPADEKAEKTTGEEIEE